MSDVSVRHLRPHHYAVSVSESQGSPRTDHEVTVDDRFVDDFGLVDVDQQVEEELVRDSIGFLLEQEKATAIEHTFTLSDLADTFPGYVEEMRARRS